MQAILDWLGKHPTLVTILGGVGAAVFASGLQLSWGHWTVAVWAVGIALCIGLPAANSSRNRLQQGRQAALTCVRNVLAACAAAYGYPDNHVRANVMLLQKNRRRVDQDTAANMDSDSDCDLEIDATAGVSGEAFVRCATAYGDLTLMLGPGGPTWGLRDSEVAKVRRDLKSILSVPVFDPDNPSGPLLGTLQVDSDLSYQQMGFDKPERRAVAERFADVVALLLKVGR